MRRLWPYEHTWGPLRGVLHRIGVVIVFVASLGAGRAVAFPSSRLVYTRASGASHCPDETALRRAVARRLGYDPFFPSAPRTIVASVVVENERLKGLAQLVDEQGVVRGSRAYFASVNRCDELVAALALSISISIDPASEQPRENPHVGPAAPPSANEQREPALGRAAVGVRASDQVPRRAPAHEAADDVPPAASTSASSHDNRVRWAAAVDARLWFRASPDPALANAVSLTARWRQGSAVAELGAGWPSSSDFQMAGETARVSFSRIWVGIAPCAHWDPFFVCGVLTATRFSVQRADVDGLGDDGIEAATGARLGWETPLGSTVNLRLQSDLLATLTRTSVTLRAKEVWRTPPWSMAFSAALAVYFP